MLAREPVEVAVVLRSTMLWIKVPCDYCRAELQRTSIEAKENESRRSQLLRTDCFVDDKISPCDLAVEL